MKWLHTLLLVGVLMATNLNQIITAGVGSPGGIPQIMLFGLSPTPIVNPHIARPDADISSGTWQPNNGLMTNLYGSLDETVADDIDYILIEYVNPVVQQTCELRLSDMVVPAGSTIMMRFRAMRVFPAGSAILEVRLMQGSTQIAMYTPTLTASFADYSYTLSAEEAASITDYADLRVKFSGIVSVGRKIYVSYFAVVMYRVKGSVVVGDAGVGGLSLVDALFGGVSVGEAGVGGVVIADS